MPKQSVKRKRNSRWRKSPKKVKKLVANLKKQCSSSSSSTSVVDANNNSTSDTDIFDFNRIVSFSLFDFIITASNNHGQQCNGTFELQNDCRFSRVTTWSCIKCKFKLSIEPSKLIDVGNKRKVREHIIREPVARVLSGLSNSAESKYRSQLGLLTVDPETQCKTVKNILLPALKGIFNEHVSEVLDNIKNDFIAEYQKSHGVVPSSDMLIPIEVEFDGRHQKYFGRNSLDGHVAVGLMGQNTPIFMRSYHRKTPSMKRKTTNYNDAPGNIDRTVAKEVCEFLFEKGFDVVSVCRDNDASTIEIMTFVLRDIKIYTLHYNFKTVIFIIYCNPMKKRETWELFNHLIFLHAVFCL